MNCIMRKLTDLSLFYNIAVAITLLLLGVVFFTIDVFIVGSTVTMLCMHRLPLVALKCQEMAENSVNMLWQNILKSKQSPLNCPRRVHENRRPKNADILNVTHWGRVQSKWEGRGRKENGNA